MKINEVLKEGLINPDASGKNIFIDNLVNQIHDYIDSIRQSNQQLKMWDFVQSYFTQYGWTANPQQTQLLQRACADVDREYNYFLQQAKKQEPQQEPTQAAPTPQELAAQKRAEKLSAAGAAAQSQMMPFSKMPTPAVWKNNRAPIGTPASSSPQAAAAVARQNPATSNPAVWKSNRTGQPMKMNEGVLDWAKGKLGTMAGSFASKLGLGTVTKLANLMYTVGVTQVRDPKTKLAVGAGAATAGTVDNPILSNQAQTIIKTMTPMKGEEYKDDLETIVRLALNNLYKSDPGDYGTEVKRIMGKKPNQTTQPNQADQLALVRQQKQAQAAQVAQDQMNQSKQQP